MKLIPAVRMLAIVKTKLIAPSSDAIERMCSDRIQRSTPFPGLNSVSLSGGYAVQLAADAPPFAAKLMYSTMPPNRNSQ